MSSAKKPRTPSRSAQTRQIEFTPGQMIIAICTLIAFGLVCFMLGVLVNKLDGSLAPATTSVTEADTPAVPDAPRPSTQRTSPLPPESLRDQVASRNEATTPAAPSQPRAVAPPPAVRRPDAAETAQQPAARQTPPLSPAAQPVPNTASASEPAAPVLEPPPPTEPRLLENVEHITPGEPTPGETAQPAPSSAPASAAFGVQIASLSADRAEQARRALADAEKLAEEKGRLVPTEDGRLLRVIIGSYESRADATRLMERMRQRSEFEGCFVQNFSL